MSATDEFVDDFLEHFGVKGMKWGVRNPEKRAARQDRRFTKNANTLNTKIEIHNAAGRKWEKDLDVINAKPQYVKAGDAGHLLINDHPTNIKYTKECMDSYVKRLNEAAGEHTSKTGNLTYQVQQNDYDVLGFTVTTKKIRHADDSFEDTFTVRFVKDEEGFIVGLEFVEDLAQSAIDRVLEHYGVKGMKWGVRRNRSSRVTTTDRKRSVKTSGGHGRPAHPEALRAYRVGQVAKSSGVKALSNEDLKTYQNRLQLEQNVKRLQYNEKSSGERFVRRITGRAGEQSVQNLSTQEATKLGESVLSFARSR